MEANKERSIEDILHSHPICSNSSGSDLFVSLESAKWSMEEYSNQWKDAYIAKDAQLETLKQKHDELKAENARLKYGHELVTDALKNLQGNFNELKAENGELQQSFNQRGKVINNWKHSHARLEKEHTALKEKAEQVATILGALCATVRPILEGNNAEYLFLNAKTVLNSATEFISSYNSSTNNQTISKDE